MPPPESASAQGPGGSLWTPARSRRARTWPSSSRSASWRASGPNTRGSWPGSMAGIPSVADGVALARGQGLAHGGVERHRHGVEAGFAGMDLVVPEAGGGGVDAGEIDHAEEAAVARVARERAEHAVAEAVLQHPPGEFAGLVPVVDHVLHRRPQPRAHVLLHPGDQADVGGGQRSGPADVLDRDVGVPEYAQARAAGADLQQAVEHARVGLAHAVEGAAG